MPTTAPASPAAKTPRIAAGKAFRHARYADGEGNPAVARIISTDDDFVTYQVNGFGRLIRSRRDTFERSVLPNNK